MIRRLVLKDWRNYDDVRIAFNPGTTFVVALNGVGKTSLVEAARFALFGTIQDAAAAVKAGSKSATATVELELPSGRLLTLSRTLTTKTSKRTPPPEPVLDLDGAPLAQTDLETLIFSEYEAESAVLARLTMPALSTEAETPSSMGLDEHLGQIYGLQRLTDAAGRMAERRTQLERRVTSVKATNSSAAQQLEDLRTEVEEAEVASATAEQLNETAQLEYQQAQENQTAREQAAAWKTQAATRAAEVRDITANLTDVLGEPITADDTGLAIISAQVDQHRTALSDIEVQLRVNEAKASTLRANLERLRVAVDAHDDCPVCRRALDDTTAGHASEATHAELAALADEASLLKNLRAEAEATNSALEALRRRAQRLTPLPPRPAEPPSRDDEPSLELHQSRRTSAMEGLIESRTKLKLAQHALRSAQDADAAMRELADLFTQLATLTVAIDAATATRDEILNEAVKPLASAVNERWTQLFPDRGTLDTRADGTVTRTVNQHELPFSSFSAGEGAGLTLLIRLVITHMASNADFCWFDEPLEHMDPDTRRHVASMLTRAASGGTALRQIVLTTYEEPLARQLQERDPHHVHLRDVRQRIATTATESSA